MQAHLNTPHLKGRQCLTVTHWLAPHEQFFWRSVALFHNAWRDILYFRAAFIFNVRKLAILQHDLVLEKLCHTDYATACCIIEIALWCITQFNATQKSTFMCGRAETGKLYRTTHASMGEGWFFYVDMTTTRQRVHCLVWLVWLTIIRTRYVVMASAAPVIRHLPPVSMLYYVTYTC